MASLAPLELLPSWQLPEAIPCALDIAIVAREWRALDTPAEIARWDALAQWAAEPNPFHESWYLLAALRAFDPRGEVQLLCLEAGGQLAGVLPVRRAARYYGHPVPHLTNWLHGNAFVGAPLVAQGFERAFWRELLAWCDGQPGAALFLHLSQFPTQGPLHDALTQVLAEQDRRGATVKREERAMLGSGLAPEAYLEESLSGKKRKELRRQHAFLGEAATATLFREALKGAAARGRLERLAIRLDGRPLAMLATFLCPPGAFSFKTAFDESFARFSPGVLLQRENLHLLARTDIEWTDSCAAMDHPMIDHFWRERRVVARHNIAIGGKARRLLFRALAAREAGAGARGIE